MNTPSLDDLLRAWFQYRQHTHGADTLTARTTQEMHDHLLDDANKEGWTIKQVHIENKQETR